MKIEKDQGSGLIAVFVDGLENTPGWQSLSQKKKEELLEHTSHIQQHRQLQKVGEIGELAEISLVQELIKGEEMAIRPYLRRLYDNERTISRKMNAIAKLGSAPVPLLRKLASIGTQTHGEWKRIMKAEVGDVLNAITRLPALPANTDKEVTRILEQVENKLQEGRHERARGRGLHNNQELAAKMAANAMRNYIRSCGLQTSAEKRQWLRKVVGWVMEYHAVTGTVSTQRIPIPEEVKVRRGRPRKNPLKEAA